MEYAQTRIWPKNQKKTFPGIFIYIWDLVDLGVQVDHWVGRKSEKIDKYLKLAIEVKSCGTLGWYKL